MRSDTRPGDSTITTNAVLPGGKRIGLVLAGGGAKGAYQVGCLRALRQAGLDDFSAISGSSVGAIHGVLLATGKLERASEAWSRLRFRDICKLMPHRLALMPTWMAAAFTSEFSPFSVWRFSDSCVHPVWWRRWAYFAACALSVFGLAFAASAWPPVRIAAVPLAIVLALCAALILFNRPLRRHYLEHTLTSIAPLGQTLGAALTHDDCQRMSDAGVPVYATVSRFRPYTAEAVRWGGWVPQYLRVDRMALPDLLDVLVCGSALPGFSGRTTSHGEVGIDGAWTDVLPLAPLLSESGLDLDLVFVIYLKPRFRHRMRHNSLLGVASVLFDDVRRRRGDGEEDLIRWAETRLRASGTGNGRGAAIPRIVRVMPSCRIGNFFSGTLWFDGPRSDRLAALGEQDMRDALAALAESPEWAWISARPAAGRRPDRRAGEYAPIPA